MGTHYRTWRQSRGKRLPPVDYPVGAPVHVTIATWQRVSLFEDPLRAETAFAPIREHRETLAACLMPDHLHWLVGDASSMVRTVQAYKSWSTRCLRAQGLSTQVWQRSFADRIIRSHEDLAEVSRYLVANAVRAGLVGRVKDYPYQILFPQRFDLGRRR